MTEHGDGPFSDPPGSPPSSGDGGGSSGGSGSARLNAQNAFKALLQQLGIAITPNLQQLINNAVTKNWTSTTFLFYLRQTPEYHREFPGIFNRDGTLRMSEGQYIAMRNQYESIAAVTGLRLTDKNIGLLFKNETSIAEFSQKARAIQQIRSNPVIFQQFSQTLRARGEVKGKLSMKELFKFVIGEADPSWYKIWAEASARAAAVQAGLRINSKRQPTSITRGLILKITQQGLSEQELASGFQELSTHILNTLPLSKISNYGLNKRDLTQAVFGGPKSAAIRQKIMRLLAEEEAFYEERANPLIFPGEEGSPVYLGGSTQRAAQVQ